ncbi:MAG: alpha-glucosidase [Bacteroidia bacterium]|nr:alpha-glucosidase [Bacteroidia bacterium]
MAIERKWWKEQVIYQIYPRSFKDSNGDGIGDINGIISKLDYLKLLGVDIIWLSPIYQSPNDDNGYDISDYYAIHPEFGTMEEFDMLLKGLHDRNMKLIMDIVINHSSDEHKWFEESRKSKVSPYRDYYFWREGKDGGPPNNWQSFFGGSAWELDKTTGEYYLHIFSKKQPDLNLENEKVRNEIFKILEFWLDKGVDGFRMDVVSLISKRLDFVDANQPTFGKVVEEVYSNGPRVHEYIKEMYDTVLSKYDIMTVGEGPGITTDVGLDYVGHDRGELNMIFHLDHMFLGFGPKGRFDQVPYNWNDVKNIFKDWYDAMGDSGWVSIFLDNHDFARMVSRFGNDKLFRIESAKLLSMLVLTMRGTPCIFQGSEIGMTNVRAEDISEYRDVETINFHKEFVTEGMSTFDFINIANITGRDNARTPIQWNDSPNGGFCDADDEPWIGVNSNYESINVKQALSDRGSVFYFYKELLHLRKNAPALIYGNWEVIDQESDNLYVYKRYLENEAYLVVLNHSDEHVAVDIEHIKAKILVISNYDNRMTQVLLPWEARLYKLLNV